MKIHTDIEVVNSLGSNLEEVADDFKLTVVHFQQMLDSLGECWKAEAYNKLHRDCSTHHVNADKGVELLRCMAEELQHEATLMMQAYSAD